MYKKIKLSNNLTVLLIPSKESYSVDVSIYVKAGSRYENEKNNGIAHFLEHMAFKGTKTYPTQFETVKVIEGMGASYNASTGNEIIKYYITAESSNVKLIISMLYEMLFEPKLNPADIEKEKGVIIEEINMYNDIPEDKVQLLGDKITWENHPLGRNIAGTKENVSSFVRDDFISYKEGLFSASNIVIGVSGKFDEAQIVNLLENTFGKITDFPVRNFEPAVNAQKEIGLALETKKTEQSHVCINFKTFGRDDERKYILKLASFILGGGMSSRLFQKIRTEKGLAYSIYSSSHFFIDTGVFQICAGVANDKVCETISEIGFEIRNFLENVTQEEVSREKNHYKGVLALLLENHKSLNSFLCEQELLSDKVFVYEDVVKKIDEISLLDVVSVAREILKSTNANIALVGPADEVDFKNYVDKFTIVI